MHTRSEAEARYITGILNSIALVERVRPLQAVGLFGARHFDKYVFSVPFGRYDRPDAKHLEFVTLVARAKEVDRPVVIWVARPFKAARKLVTRRLAPAG